MGRPPSITGTIMSGYVLECEVLLAQAKKLSHAALAKRSKDPIHYIGAIGELQQMMDQVDLAVRNIRATIEANGELPGGLDDPAMVLSAITRRVRAHRAGAHSLDKQ